MNANYLIPATFWLIGLVFSPATASAGEMIFALVGKSIDDINFIRAGEGCAEEAAANGDTCLLLGAPGAEHFRLQDEALTKALAMKLSGVAISVTHSEWLANHSLKSLRERKIPLITFDSDLEEAHRHLRAGYVGVDNRAFGRHLGRLAAHFRPRGGRLCLLSGGKHNPNLNERIFGIRQQLSGNEALPRDSHLAGEQGWYESGRCPLFSLDDQSVMLRQMNSVLATPDIDVIVSVGGWPVVDPDQYRQLFQPGRHKPYIVIGIGEPLPAQLELLQDSRVDAYLSIDFRQMGRESYRLMSSLANGESIPDETFIESEAYLRKRSLGFAEFAQDATTSRR